MQSNAWARTAPSSRDASAVDRAAITRSLLACGVLVGPFYLATGVIQGFARDGFDFARHALSHLANGSGGWVQTANFVLSGAMVMAAAIGIARAIRPRSRAVSWALVCFGASMLAGAMFPADAVDGFPPGTPEGFPTTVSTTGLLHFTAGGIGFLSLAVSCVLGGVAMLRRKEPAMAWLSFIAGVAVAVGFFGPMLLPGSAVGIAGIWFSVVAGWTWLAAMSLRLYRTVPHPERIGR
jgi:hypothetical membrane protein